MKVLLVVFCKMVNVNLARVSLIELSRGGLKA